MLPSVCGEGGGHFVYLCVVCCCLCGLMYFSYYISKDRLCCVVLYLFYRYID